MCIRDSNGTVPGTQPEAEKEQHQVELSDDELLRLIGRESEATTAGGGVVHQV